MMKTAPDFYLASSDDITLTYPRACWRLQRFSTPNRKDDLLTIRVDPAIPGQPFGLKTDLDIVIIAAHLEGDSLFPISGFPDRPMPVYVARFLGDDLSDRSRIEPGELDALSRAELYPSEAEARAKLTRAEARMFGKQV